MNLVLGLVVLGGSTLAVWAGITDPAGGVLAGVRNLMTGTGNTKRPPTAPAAYMIAGGGAGQVAGGVTPAGYLPAAAGVSGARATVLAQARTWLGVPYAWGGSSRRGVDCSGLVQQVYATAGVRLPRVAAAQQLAGHAVSLAAAQPGDLIFWGHPAYHVGIYVGGGQILDAAHTGTVVRVENIWAGASARDVLDSAPRRRAQRPAHHAHPAHHYPGIVT